LITLEDYERTAPVRWAIRRHELLWYLHELASPTFQQERWIEMKPGRPGVMYGFDFVVHFFFDDTELGEHPRNTLGDLLTDEQEVTALRNVVDALDRVLQELSVGRDKADVEYVTSPRWPNVIATTREAYRLMRPRLRAEGDTALPPELSAEP